MATSRNTKPPAERRARKAEEDQGGSQAPRPKRSRARRSSLPAAAPPVVAVPIDGRQRVLIERASPQIDGGRYPAKRIAGDVVTCECDLVADGHDVLAGVLRYRHEDHPSWHEVALEPLVNDRWAASFTATEMGRWLFTFEAWIDHFATWRRGLRKKAEVGQDVGVDLLIGAAMVKAAAARAHGEDADALRDAYRQLASEELPITERTELALEEGLAHRMAAHPDRSLSAKYRELAVWADRERARYGSWYEFFPRSTHPDAPHQHGTFATAERMLDYVAELGFDVVYLPPIHPIGETFRKGRNNTLFAQPGDPGSPWAIGNEAGGHTAIHPELGTLDDFRRFVRKAEERGLEIAMDVAFQASPDHPWVKEHPAFFVERPDGTIQYAENPPKKYQDIYPLNFESAEWRTLWETLRDVFLFWCDKGVRIFRVDNPHTKSLLFWEWCISEVRERHRDALFLAEAFTRPKLMYNLAKAGFTQSYTYFTWRNHKQEIEEYLTELTRTEVADYFRPSFWPNTPDILPEHLQHGGRPAFLSRLVLATTLTSSWGMYGPAFELMEHVARPGSEEYIDNEKYELKKWDLDRPDSLRFAIQRMNEIRRKHRALQSNETLHFHPTDNDMLMAYSKRHGDDVVLVVVSLDHHWRQGGFVQLDMSALGLDWHQSYQVHDVLGEGRWLWHGARNYVELDPHVMPAHVFHVRGDVQSEGDPRWHG